MDVKRWPCKAYPMKKAHGGNIYAHVLVSLSLHYCMLSMKTINPCATTIAPDLNFMNNKYVVIHKRLSFISLSLLVLICIRSTFQWINAVLCFYIKCATQDEMKRKISKVFSIKKYLISYSWTIWFLYFFKKSFIQVDTSKNSSRQCPLNVLFSDKLWCISIQIIKKDLQNILPIKSWQKHENWHYFI